MGQLKQTNVSVIEVSKEGEREMLKKHFLKMPGNFPHLVETINP